MRVAPLKPRRDLLLASWLERDIPPRDYLLGSVLCTTSRWLMFGETGVGKSLLGGDMGGAVASGSPLLGWGGRRRARVMYLDGEMPGRARLVSWLLDDSAGEGTVEGIRTSSANADGSEQTLIRLSIRASLKRTGKEMKFIVEGVTNSAPADTTLIRLLVRGQKIAKRMFESNCPRLCQSNGQPSAYGATRPDPKRPLGREGAPLGQPDGPSLFVSLASDEMALLIEMVVHPSMN